VVLVAVRDGVGVRLGVTVGEGVKVVVAVGLTVLVGDGVGEGVADKVRVAVAVLVTVGMIVGGGGWSRTITGDDKKLKKAWPSPLTFKTVEPAKLDLVDMSTVKSVCGRDPGQSTAPPLVSDQ
jgi:hypothetical protein